VEKLASRHQIIVPFSPLQRHNMVFCTHTHYSRRTGARDGVSGTSKHIRTGLLAPSFLPRRRHYGHDREVAGAWRDARPSGTAVAQYRLLNVASYA
jgi:hypothetical protein